MSEIRKAGSYFKYIMALFVAGLFGLFGRGSPSWADDVKQQRNTKIFQQEFYGAGLKDPGKLYAQVTSTSTSGTTSTQGDLDLINPPEPQAIIAILAFTSEDAARTQEKLNEQYSAMISKLYNKIYEGETLSSDEMTLLMSNELKQEVDRLKNELQKLSSGATTTTTR